MRYLFVAYCIGSSQGQPAQIGAYKRGLRVGLELVGRGHEILFYCTGRHNFRDALTVEANRQMQFVEFPFCKPAYEGARENRATFLARLKELQPDVVVIGDAPMAGPMLETTLCAVEARIPAVCLDNAYNPGLVDMFCQDHGPMLDGIVLSGPSALHGPTSYRYLARVPPYIDGSLPEAHSLLRDELGMEARRLLLVLAYDRNVERLGISLIKKLGDPDLEVLFVSPDVAGGWERLGELRARMGDRARVIPPPTDRILFGLLQVARCAVTKCGYMQVTESLSLGTPVISLYYQGDFSLSILPKVMESFAHATHGWDADPETVSAARRFLELEPQELRVVHDGTLGAAARTADFLEALSPIPRGDTSPECARQGFTHDRLRAALLALGRRGGGLVIHQVRSTYLRRFPDHALHALVCDCSLRGERSCVRLWGRVFKSRRSLAAESRRAKLAGSPRQVLFASAWARTMIEVDLGEEVLPSIKELQTRSIETPNG